MRMRQGTTNVSVHQALDSKIREGQKNISYLSDSLKKLQVSQSTQTGGGPRRGSRDDPTDVFDPVYTTLPTPRPNYTQQPGPGIPKPRNQTKLGSSNDQAFPVSYANKCLDLIKYDTPHTTAKITLMLQQLEFKLTVERQYKEGIDKMLQLYEIEGERRAKSDAKQKQLESQQKLQLLKRALKRYEDLHIDIDEEPTADDESMNLPNSRKPLSGQLHIGVKAVREADHAATSSFRRSPETYVVIKVEDAVLGKTAKVRNDKWFEDFDLEVEKGNEVEITLYDKTGDGATPIGLLWIRLSDLSDELRRKKNDREFEASGGKWVSADNMTTGGSPSRDGFPSIPGGLNRPGSSSALSPASGQVVAQNDTAIEAWFALEPAGQILLSLDFVKHTAGKTAVEGRGGLRRQAAIRQRKEEVHEMYGHKFVQQQFYQIMRCALCGEFLKNAAGYQCADCKYTCHKKCYPRVVTKCISKSNAETDPDEAKLNHRIPHRFEPVTNMSANWCCHCGYLLPLGKKNARKCSECNLTCHTHCAHLVPDFCGMTMEMANQILAGIRSAQTSIASTRAKAPRTSMVENMNGGLAMRAPQQRAARRPILSEPSYIGGQEPAYDARPSNAGRSYAQGIDPAAAAVTALDRRSSRQSPAASPISETPPARGSTPSRPGTGSRSMSAAAAAAAAAASAALNGATSQSGAQPASRPANYTQRNSYQQQVGNSRGQQSTTSNLESGSGGLRLPDIPSFSPIVAQSDQFQPAGDGTAPDLPREQVVQRSRKVGLADFNFIAVLGKGNFGKVMLAEYKATNKLYAIKVLKKDFIIENDEVESTRSEKRVFLVANKERHPFLINLHSCFQTETRVYFVMDYVSGGDLMLHIQKEQFGRQRARFYAAEVCLALKYFHENGIIYRDLKLDNILLGTDGHIKVADYGLCKEEMWPGQTTTTFCGTPEFMAPEILAEQRYGRAVDWWAFGVLIYQMLLGQSPFRGEDEDEIFDAILSDEVLYPLHMPRDSVDILKKLLTREPDARLGCGPTDALEIMRHPFFADINWDDVYHKRVKPIFVPTLRDATDTSNFDEEFTKEQPKLTPGASPLSPAMQEQFRGFSVTCDV